MITLTTLVITLIVLAVIAAIVLATGGLAFIVAFGDVIIAAGVIALIARHFIKKRGTKKGV